jgi:hypothetical protein
MSGIAAEVNEVLGIGVPVDHALAGIDRGSPLRIDHRHLARVAAGIFVGDPLHHVGGRQSLFEQRDGLRAVLTVRRCLRSNGAHAGLRVRHRGARPERA